MGNATIHRCTAYRGKGDPISTATDFAVDETDAFQPPFADRTPIRRIMSKDIICARPDLEVSTVLRLLVEHRIGCMPVVDELSRPVGVITKLDFIEEIDASIHAAAVGAPFRADLAARTAEDLMMPVVVTVDERATVADVASRMKAEYTHHVLVVRASGALVGIVSAHDIVRWVVEQKQAARFEPRPPRWYPLEG